MNSPLDEDELIIFDFDLLDEDPTPQPGQRRATRNFGLQQQIRKCFLNNGPFLMSTSQTDITITQNHNVMAVNVRVGRNLKTKTRALEIWNYITSRMKEEGWDILDEVDYHESTGMLYMLLGCEKIVDQRIRLDGKLA